MVIRTFLSYCHEDRSEAEQLRVDLMTAGFEVWWDGDIKGGQDWRHEIRSAIKQSHAILLCLSKRAVSRNQAGIYPEALSAIEALRERKPGESFLIPVKFTACETPHLEIDSVRTLDRLQHIDLYPTNQRAENLGKLLEAIRNAARSFRRAPAGGMATRPAPVSVGSGGQTATIAPPAQTEATISTGGVEKKPDVKSTTIELTIDRSFDEFGENQQQQFLIALGCLLKMESVDIRIKNREPGSVKLTIEIPENKAQILLGLMKSGGLRSVDVIAARVLKTDSEPNYWVRGGFTLEVTTPDAVSWKIRFFRPYAIIGRLPGSDLIISDRGVSAKHAFFYLSKRGLFVVDLASRTGTRVGANGGPSGWVEPGETVEIAGYSIKLIEYKFDPECGYPEERDGNTADPLADVREVPRTRLWLYPSKASDCPIVLGSELVFGGRSRSCGIVMVGGRVSRIHCVFVQTETNVYLTPFGPGAELNGASFDCCSVINNGDHLAIGDVGFSTKIDSARRLRPTPPLPPSPKLDGTQDLAQYGRESASPPSVPSDLVGVPSSAQHAVLSWMMSILQTTQVEMFRRQTEFQQDIVKLLRVYHQENSVILMDHMKRIDAINQELLSLREEIRQRFGDAQAAQQSVVASAIFPTEPAAATYWLLDRVRKLEERNRSSWQDLFAQMESAPNN